MTLCVLSMAMSAQQDPMEWIPLRVGTRWVYEHEWKSGDRSRPDIDRWTTQETITGWMRIPEGLVVLREVRDVRPPRMAHPGYLVTRDREPYLVHGNCVYAIADGWDAPGRRLRPSYREYLAQGAVSPDFCFPLQTGRKWGNNDIPWRVEPAREGVGSFLPAEYQQAFHIFSSHFGSGGWADVWLRKGVGVVGEHYIHNGAYDEYTKKLVSFSRQRGLTGN